MAVKLRLMRMGKKKQPTYRVVAADSRSPRNGRFIEIVGTYQPRQDPSVIQIDNEKAVHWLRHGAQPTERVEKLLKISGAWEEFTGVAPEVPPIPEPTPNKGYTAPAPPKPPKAVVEAEAKAEEATEDDSAENAPAEEAASDDAPADEAASDDAPADEAPAEEASAEEAPAEEAPAEDAAEEAPAEDAAEEAPAEEAPAEEAAAEGDE